MNNTESGEKIIIERREIVGRVPWSFGSPIALITEAMRIASTYVIGHGDDPEPVSVEFTYAGTRFYVGAELIGYEQRGGINR